MWKRYGVWMLSIAAGLAMVCDAGRAQDFTSPNTSYVSPRVSPSTSYARSVREAPRSGSGSSSWLWVHAGVSVQVAGSFADWATSWKQPEGNHSLAESRGPYAGKFYRSGTAQKLGLGAGLAAISYVIGWKWPKARKYVGVFNMAVGGGFGGAAVSNVVRNPYYKP